MVYLVVVLRAMNELNEQGSYWVANTFIWNWLLLPILPLADLIKQDVASNLNNEPNKKPFGMKLLPYLIFTMMTLLIWLSTAPAWPWFLESILNADKPDLVLDLIQQLVPCYACFTFSLLLTGVMYALGRTGYLAVKSLIENALIMTLFLFFSNGILFEDNVFTVAAIFGTGLVFGTATSVGFFALIVRTQYFI